MIHCETYGRLSIWDALLRQEHRIGIGEDWIEGLMRGAGIRAKTVKKGWLYLTVALALYSRFAISWAMGFRLTMDSPEQVLTMALPTRPQGPGSCTILIAAANTPPRVTSICRSTLGYDFPSEYEARTAERNPMSTESRRGHFAQ